LLVGDAAGLELVNQRASRVFLSCQLRHAR
jgi:hypothetical protein